MIKSGRAGQRREKEETLLFQGRASSWKVPMLNTHIYIYPPDKSSMKMKTSQLQKLLASNNGSKISENGFVLLNVGVNV